MPILEKRRLTDALDALQLPEEGKQREVLALLLVLMAGWECIKLHQGRLQLGIKENYGEE